MVGKLKFNKRWCKKKDHLKSKDCILILIMKFTSRDLEANKERTFENNYEYRIEEFKAVNDYNFWDDDLIWK